MMLWLNKLRYLLQRKRWEAGRRFADEVMRNATYFSAQDRHPITDAPCVLPEITAVWFDHDRYEVLDAPPVPPLRLVQVNWWGARNNPTPADLDRWTDDGGR